jgi:hypothetical protein
MTKKVEQFNTEVWRRENVQKKVNGMTSMQEVVDNDIDESSVRLIGQKFAKEGMNDNTRKR